MKTQSKLWLLLVLFQLFLVSGWVMAEERASCRVCGMYIDEYQKTAAELVYLDGKKESTCGVACMLREIDDAGGISAFKSAKVHDWVSGKLVDAETATYVLGSKVIPDMMPNYIAFANRHEAEAFVAEKGGEVIDFDFAYRDVSPVGTTAPFRIRTAVVGGEGGFSTGMMYGYMEKNRVKDGSNGKNPSDFINGNPAQPKAPQQIQVMQQAMTFNYTPIDNLSLFVNVPWFEKRMTTLVRNPRTGAVTESVDNKNGIGDITMEGRYNFWRSAGTDKYATLLLGTTLPSGHFDGNRDATGALLTAPGMQLGSGTATFKGGLLYSERWKDFWLHTSALHTVNPENSDKFAYGDVTNLGLAFHYTPNYDLMLGIEMDANFVQKNQDKGIKIANSGGTALNLAFVSDYRFINAFGGNFKLRSSVGLPIYEDLNSNPMFNAAKKPFTQVQLGDGFFANISVVWTFRDSPLQHN